ncbi:MAG: flagellin, partial [Candidatus Gastranaerophilaceae bacterium]
MVISVNTNIASLTAQKSLNNATNKMNNAMERLSTGYKINSSKDDAAGMAVSSKLNYKISSLSIAKTNAQMGASMLDTTEGVFGTIQTNLQRIRDLTEQA